jgi:hypothetical protein
MWSGLNFSTDDRPRVSFRETTDLGPLYSSELINELGEPALQWCHIISTMIRMRGTSYQKVAASKLGRNTEYPEICRGFPQSSQAIIG